MIWSHIFYSFIYILCDTSTINTKKGKLMDILKLIEANYDKMVENRRYLHAHPELSTMEDNTCRYIIEQLKASGLEEIIDIPNGGVIAWVRGNGGKKTVMLRADIDALPIQEPDRNLSKPRVCISENDGVMHACGHDAHTSMLLAAADVLYKNKDELNGDVLLVFERGEEGGGNIKYILQYFWDNDIKYDVCFGMHVEQKLETGKFGISEGYADAGSIPVSFRITGRGGHASRPDLSNNPVDCMLEFINEINKIRMKHISPFEQLTVSICKIDAGTKSNIIPEYAEFSGSARYFSKENVRVPFEKQLKKIIKGLEGSYDCTIENLGKGGAIPLINDKCAADIARSAIAKVLGEDALCPQMPTMGSESYSQYMIAAPGCYGNLGIRNDEVGSGAEIHNPLFDIDERAMVTGAAAHVAFALEYLNGDYPLEHSSEYANLGEFLKG